MNGLVGYGSSDESDSEPETAPKPKQTPAKLTNGANSQVTPKQTADHQTHQAPTFPPVLQDKKLDISDDEDTYIPRSKSSSKPAPPPITSHLPKPAPKLQNLSEVIDKAQIVTVERENLISKEGVIASFLPKPKDNDVHELELERFHKSKRRKKDKKKKIFVLDLEDFSDEEEVKPKPQRPVSSKSASGLFSILPQPKNCKINTKSTKSVVTDRAKFTFKPRTLQPVKKKVTEEAELDVNDDNDQNGTDFFSFTNYTKSTKDIEKAAKTVKLDKFKPKQVCEL